MKTRYGPKNTHKTLPNGQYATWRRPICFMRRPSTPCQGFSRRRVWGDGAVLIISKNLPLKGKFFEMVSWGGLGGLAPLRNLRYPCLAPRRGLGGFAPQESPLITRALPPQRPCLAPVPCPPFFSSEFFRPKIFRPKSFFREDGSDFDDFWTV